MTTSSTTIIRCTCTPVAWRARTATGIRIIRRAHADHCHLGRYIAEHDTTVPRADIGRAPHRAAASG